MNRNKQYDYDLIVIGSGAGGSVAAHIANNAGLEVAIVEPGMIGGECPNIGCVPTKALLQAAEVYEAAKHAGRFGIRSSSVGYNYPSIKAWKNLAVKRTGTYLGEEIYSSEGINLIAGSAHFIDDHTISIGKARYSSRYFLIATGAKIIIPPITGLENSGYITSTEALDLSRPPKSLAIIGGGAIGCEFAQLFSIFGTKVHIIDLAPNLLMREDKEAGEFLKKRFENQYSVSVSTETIVEKVEKFGPLKRLTLNTKGKLSIINVEEVLVATGKKAVVDIGLENAGVTYKKGSIDVNRHMQTKVSHIFAAGDCVGPYMFTHMATYQSRIVANNILHPKKMLSARYDAVPRCIFTNPEIASVGLSEQELKDKKIDIKTAITPITVIGRANTSDVGDGFVKVIVSAKSKVVLGATIASPRAGEMIHELTLAVTQRLTALQVAETIHAFPTWSEAVKVTCAKLAK